MIDTRSETQTDSDFEPQLQRWRRHLHHQPLTARNADEVRSAQQRWLAGNGVASGRAAWASTTIPARVGSGRALEPS